MLCAVEISFEVNVIDTHLMSKVLVFFSIVHINDHFIDSEIMNYDEI